MTEPRTADRPFGDAPAWRRTLAIAAVVSAPIAIAVTTSRWQDNLPDPMPTHWSDRLPDGFTSYGGFSATVLGIAVTAAVAASATVMITRVLPAYRRVIVAVCGAVAWFAAGIWGVIALVAWEAADPASVPIGASPLLAIACLAAGGGVTWWLYGGTARPLRPAPAVVDRPVVDLPRGQRVAWTRRASAPAFSAIAGVVLLTAALPWLVGAPPAVGLISLAAAVLVAGLSSIRVSADQRGLIVGGGLVGWPRKRIPTAQICAASISTIRPLEWGGWGYRVMPGRSAVVLRAGPGLVIDLIDGRQFAVTVDDAHTGAAVINALVGRERVGDVARDDR